MQSFLQKREGKALRLNDYTAQVFIDLPNVLYRHCAGRKERIHVQPHALAQYIRRQMIAGHEVTHLAVYVPGVLKEYAAAMLEQFERTDMNKRQMSVVETRKEKDIDFCIVNDIWYQAVVAAARRRQRAHHVLVSGDSDYYHTYKCIRKLVPADAVDITMSVLSWRSNCASLWATEAHHLHYLDDVPGLVTAARHAVEAR